MSLNNGKSFDLSFHFLISKNADNIPKLRMLLYSLNYSNVSERGLAHFGTFQRAYLFPTKTRIKKKKRTTCKKAVKMIQDDPTTNTINIVVKKKLPGQTCI